MNKVNLCFINGDQLKAFALVLSTAIHRSLYPNMP